MDSSSISPDTLLSQVVSEMKKLPVAEVMKNAQEVRYSVARAIIRIMGEHKERVESWYVDNQEDVIGLMGRIETFVSVLVGAETSLSTYEEPIPLSPNSKRPTQPIHLEYSGREWELTPVNFYLSLAVLAKRMDIIERLVASNDK